MRRLALLGILLGAAACNTSTSGANGNLAFTPTNCGVVAGCDFADSIGVGGKVDVQIDALDSTPTAGLDLASRDTTLLTVTPTADINGQPAWELTALGAGVAQLAAVDTNGDEVDFVEVPMQDVVNLTMVPFVGNVVGPTPEGSYEEAFTVNANTDVSWFVRPLIAGDAETMGRFSFETVLNPTDPDVTQYEQANSDRPNGYFYVNLPVGDYPIEFQLSINPDNVGVTSIIHAQ